MSSGSMETDGTLPKSETNGTFSIDTILNDDTETLEHPDFKDKPGGGWDEETKEGELPEGFCVECEGESSPN